MKYIASILLSGLVIPAFAAPPSPPEGFKWAKNADYSDEFNGSALDTEKWYDHHPRWRGRPPARFMPENVSVTNGHLRLTNGMLEKPIGPYTIGGAAIVSRKTGALYGYYECRMKASGISMSSTFWLSNSPKRIPGVGRVSQELDIQETVGGAKRNPGFRERMNYNTHVRYTRAHHQKGSHAELSPATDEAFHTYGAWWIDAKTVRFYCNDEYIGKVEFDTSITETPFDQPMHVNMVTETYDWETPPTPEEVGNPEINTTLYDWVRAYTLEPSEDKRAESTIKKQAVETK